MTGNSRDAAACWRLILSDVVRNRNLLGEVAKLARENRTPAKIVFGTSGWRGEIGTDFTINNIRVVTEAIIKMFKEGDETVMKAMGLSGFSEIQKRGVIVGHDNRFLGPEFAMEVIGRLQREGIGTWYAGEATTPEFSTGVTMLNAACSVNLTPSHNPANYGGFKFNPSDGGPAGPEITSEIERIANDMMAGEPVLEPAVPFDDRKVDLTELYMDYLLRRGTIDLDRIREFITSADCLICIDNVHGASRGRIERIVGKSDKIRYLRTGDDYLFGGVAPEPSHVNMEGIRKVLNESSAPFRMGVILDPDGDRIRHADDRMEIPMNYFGAMALHFLHVHKHFSGIAAKSVGTSNFVNAIGEKLGVKVRETKVGFKNFRPFMSENAGEKAVVVFEESDGISGYRHTLEKDALFGILLAIEMIAVTGRNLSEYLKDLMDEYGYYYPDRSGIEVDRSLSGERLAQKLSRVRERYGKGSEITVGGRKKTVVDVISLDGTKLVLHDGSWLMMRPSGTEPKVRFYIEARTEEEKKELFVTAELLTREALETD